MNKMTKETHTGKEEIQKKASSIGEMMKELIDVSMIDPCKLRNCHNTLFLSLMEKL